MADHQFNRVDPISELRRVGRLKNGDGSRSHENRDRWAVVEAGVVFDGMIPDPILETDLVLQLEEQDSHGPGHLAGPGIDRPLMATGNAG